jgi:hypothetical protein
MNFSCTLCGSRDWPTKEDSCPLCRAPDDPSDKKQLTDQEEPDEI